MTKKRKSIFKVLIYIILFIPRGFISLFSGSKKKKSKSKTESSFSNSPLNEMERLEYEPIVYGIFKQRGYVVSEKEGGACTGVDLVLKRTKEITYVQCQHWVDKEVDITSVSEFYVAMEMDGVEHGIVITSGGFSSEAIDFSLGKSLMLINGEDLIQMIDALKQSLK